MYTTHWSAVFENLTICADIMSQKISLRLNSCPCLKNSAVRKKKSAPHGRKTSIWTAWLRGSRFSSWNSVQLYWHYSNISQEGDLTKVIVNQSNLVAKQKRGTINIYIERSPKMMDGTNVNHCYCRWLSNVENRLNSSLKKNTHWSTKWHLISTATGLRA